MTSPYASVRHQMRASQWAHHPAALVHYQPGTPTLHDLAVVGALGKKAPVRHLRHAALAHTRTIFGDGFGYGKLRNRSLLESQIMQVRSKKVLVKMYESPLSVWSSSSAPPPPEKLSEARTPFLTNTTWRDD